MPVKNCQGTVGASVRSLLAQTFTDWELLLIDDGSTDSTPGVLRQLNDRRIKILIDSLQRGLPARLNQAISLSTGKYFARMDGDDTAYPQRFERQIGYLEENPEVDLVGAWIIVFDQQGRIIGKRIGPERHRDICTNPVGGFPMAHPTYIGSLNFFKKHQYCPRYSRCEDQEMLLRAHSTSCFANVPEILLGYREVKLDLSKILKGRQCYANAILHYYLGNRRPALALRGMLSQMLKGVIDCVAVGSGLNYRVLRHRARLVSKTEELEWLGVWRMIAKARHYRPSDFGD